MTQVTTRVVHLDVEMPFGMRRLPGVEAVDGDIGEINPLMVAEDVERPAAGMGVQVQDTDGLHLLERLECGEGEPVELAETVAGVTTRMMETAGQAARTTVLQGLLDRITHAAGRGQDAVQKGLRPRSHFQETALVLEGAAHVLRRMDQFELLARRVLGRLKPHLARLPGFDQLGDQPGFGDRLGLAFDDIGGAVVDGERGLRHDDVMPARRLSVKSAPCHRLQVGFGRPSPHLEAALSDALRPQDSTRTRQ